MARLVSRSRSWLRVALTMLILAGVGLGWGYTRFRRQSDGLSLGVQAYDRRDFSQAADLARRRLRAAPDDLEALRLLARSTARLGRDGPANAMFARLGSESLRAEDLFLLGRGLMRSGREREAQAVWQKAVALEPGHSETLEQLVAVLTSQNRLIEAAGLAERLAGQPGFELSGELSLASIRAQLGDPAAAATLLQQTLLRPEATRLDAASRAQYRKLLARMLLETGQPALARAQLQEVLKAGSDQQASWLMSRALLQAGTPDEADAAREAAGSYRAEHPLEWEPGRFIGEDRCVKCHPGIAQAHRAGRHSSTLLRAAGLSVFPFPTGNIPDPDHPAVIHRFYKDGGRVEFETTDADRVHRTILAYAFGSPDHYVSFVGQDEQGRPLIIRLSRYQSGEESGWVRTTGHSADGDAAAGGGGKPLDAVDGVYKCLFCHATAPSAVLKNVGPEASDRGIGCERCHGPGGNHLLATQASFPDPSIVNPVASTGEARLGLCGQCHGFHQDSPLPRDDPFWIRFQSTTLAWSRCYTSSDGALDCVTCHDPHQNAKHGAAFYEQKCLACHSATSSATRKEGLRPDGGVRRPAESPLAGHAPQVPRRHVVAGPPCPVSSANGCLACHMPSHRSEPLHAAFADHYIRIHRPERTPSATP